MGALRHSRSNTSRGPLKALSPVNLILHPCTFFAVVGDPYRHVDGTYGTDARPSSKTVTNQSGLILGPAA